jgi:hypothetical protein
MAGYLEPLSRSMIAFCCALESDLEFISGRSITTAPCGGLRRERYGFPGFGYFSEIEYLAKDRLLDGRESPPGDEEIGHKDVLIASGQQNLRGTGPIELIDVVVLGELYEDDDNDFTDYHCQAVILSMGFMMKMTRCDISKSFG